MRVYDRCKKNRQNATPCHRDALSAISSPYNGANSRKQSKNFVLRKSSMSSSREVTANEAISELTMKVVIVGDANVGKTSIISRLVDNTFEPGYFPTIGCPLSKKDFTCGNRLVHCNIFDTTGVQDYIGITSIQLRDSNVVVFIASFDDAETITNIGTSWVNKINDCLDPDTYLKFFILNKSDVDIDNQADMIELATGIAKDMGVKLLPVSAKTGDGVAEAFQFIAEAACERFFVATTFEPSPVNLSEAEHVERNRCC